MALSAAQLELRRTRLGASELYSVLDPRLKYRLWHQKMTGNSPFTGKEDFIRMGNLLERPTAEDYAFRRAQGGSRVRLLQTQTEKGEPVTLIDPRRHWLCGTPDFLPVRDVPGAPLFVPDIDTIIRLRDAGQLDRGLEIKTNSAVAEHHLSEDDRWGQGYRVALEELEELLSPHAGDPRGLARDLMARYSLQKHIGGAEAETEEDQWGDPGTAQMPRRYICQCVGYMAITGLDRWDLHRMRAGWGRFETITYTVHRDPEMEGMILEAGERFVRDHLVTGKPPEQVDVESQSMELERLFPKDNGALRPAGQMDLVILETFREATIALKRAEVYKELVELEVQRRIGDDKGLDARAGGLGNISWGQRAGRTSIDAKAAIQGLCDRLTEWVPRTELEPMAQAALEAATKVGDPYRQMSRPTAWTKGIEDQVRAEMTGKLLAAE